MQLQLPRADSVLSIGSSQPAETPRSGFSSFGTRVPSISSRDAALYSLAQGLVPVINDPSVQSHLNPAWCWPFGGNSDSFTTPPPLSHSIVYEVTLQDFRRYMRVMADKYNRFEANLANIAQEQHTLSTPDSETGINFVLWLPDARLYPGKHPTSGPTVPPVSAGKLFLANNCISKLHAAVVQYKSASACQLGMLC